MKRFKGWKGLNALLVLCGALAIAAPAQTFRHLADFQGNNGIFPVGSLVQGTDGNFYGTTYVGGSGSGCYGVGLPGCGTVFRISAAGRMETLYSFCSQPNCADGAYPLAGLVLGLDGVLYGTTSGGPEGCGTIFKITQRGELTTVYSLASQDGCDPTAGLVQAADGNLYGSTAEGPDNNGGSVFKITPDGKLTTLIAVPADPNQLIQARDNNFYGTTPGGYGFSEGGVFRMTPEGHWRTLYKFCSQRHCADGAYPQDALVQGNDGSFYGTTSSGAINDLSGTVFKIAPQGALTTLYFFCSQPNCADGRSPGAGLVLGTDGKFYGTTPANGAYCQNCGTIYSISANGILTTLHSFDVSDGAQSDNGLLQATSGIFYGETGGGGFSYEGTVFSLDMGLGPFVTFIVPAGKVGQTGGVLGQGFTGTTSVMLNGVPANFTVVSDTFMRVTVPEGATTGYVTVTTPTGVLKSNVPFHVIR
jgi:uncharacterized repeat protein (TIGR03803 family)